MTWRIVGILGIVVILGVLGWAVYTKIIQPSENQRAENITNYTFEPHQTFGCASYKVLKEAGKAPEVK